MASLALPALGTLAAQAGNQPHQWSYQLLQTLPHSPNSFTQGLVKDGNFLIESSGLYRKSFLHRYPAYSPEQDDGQYMPLSADLFAEGIALLDNKLYMLTWRKQQVLVFDPRTLQLQQRLSYQGEGWGLATYGQQLVMSNGSSQLNFRDRHDFAIERTVTVTEAGQPTDRINDLTVAQGLVWANVWFRNDLLAIDPDSGRVIGTVSLEPLANKHRHAKRGAVLNGIAWDEQAQAFWITGKFWDKRYLIRVNR